MADPVTGIHKNVPLTFHVPHVLFPTAVEVSDCSARIGGDNVVSEPMEVSNLYAITSSRTWVNMVEASNAIGGWAFHIRICPIRRTECIVL